MPTLAPAYAGIRGEAAGPAIYEAGESQVMLTAQPSGAAAGRYELLGLLVGPEPAGLTANLWQGEDLIATVPVDEGGNFVFSNLAPGGYELIIGGQGRKSTSRTNHLIHSRSASSTEAEPCRKRNSSSNCWRCRTSPPNVSSSLNTSQTWMILLRLR